MYTSTPALGFVIAALLAGAAVHTGYHMLPSVQLADASKACIGDENNNASHIDCWYDLIHDTFTESGLQSAMRAFMYIYETQPEFASTGCHRHAHRVGDAVYYEQYVPVQSLDAINFPQETTACGYGFFHGFIEHLIQDHPTSEFITDTCQHLTDRLADRMGDIRITCYHGAGHGLMLAQAEMVSRSEWGQVLSFVQVPLLQCEALPEANESEIEECKEGVFNILVDWMEIDDYGFTYDTESPFAVCDQFKQKHQKACYYEMAQKIAGLVSDSDPVEIAEFISSVESDELRKMSFTVAVAGVMQSVAALGPDGYMPVLERCVLLSDDLLGACLRSVANGLFEHGSPQEEYKEAVGFCHSPIVQATSVSEVCWRTVGAKLYRFYPSNKREDICRSFPLVYRHYCNDKYD